MRLARSITKLKKKEETANSSPTEVWCLPAPTETKPEEREFEVDSGASMHRSSRKDLNSAELETVQVSKNTTTLVTPNREVQSNEEATVCVKQLEFVTVKLLGGTPAVLSPGKLCEDHGYAYGWITGQLPHLIKDGKKIQCHTENYVFIVVPSLSSGSSSSATSTSPTTLSQDSENSTMRPAITRSENVS